MIKLELSINNPFARHKWKPIYSTHYKLSKNKVFEIEIQYYRSTIFLVEIDINFTKKNHAGPRINLGIFGLEFLFYLYDSRHWDYENDKWYSKDDSIR